jgi:hypothetical protein
MCAQACFLSALSCGFCAVKGAASVQLQVSPPQDTGGLPILGYAIVRQENWLGAYSEVVISPATHTSPQYIDVVGLVPATGYMYDFALLLACEDDASSV